MPMYLLPTYLLNTLTLEMAEKLSCGWNKKRDRSNYPLLNMSD
ncbi:hypothetical protein [Nostoc sp. LEGE 06077]|nr:hypothetical protein [Nostoc sp. LEGE 06077]